MSQPPTFLPPPQTQLPPPSTFTQPSSQSGYPQQPQYPSSQPGYGDSYGPRYAQQPYPSGGNNGLSSQQPASSQFQSAVNTNNSYYPPPPPQSSSYQSSSAQQLPPVNNSQYVSSYGQPQQPRDRYYSGQGFELPAPPRGTYLPNPLDTVPSYKGATYSQPSGPYNSNTQASQYPISSSGPQQHYASIQPRSPPVLSYKTFSSGPPQPGPPNQTYSSQPLPPSNYPTASSSLGYAPQSNSQYQPVSNYPKSSAPYAHFSVPNQLSPPQTQNTLPPPVPSSYGQPSSGGYSSQQPQHQQQKPYNPHTQQEPVREFVIPSNNMPMTVPPPAQPKPQPPQPQFNRVDPASVTDPTRLFPKKRGRPPKSNTADLSQRFNDILERAASNEAIPDMRGTGESLKKKARVDSVRSDGIMDGYDSPNGNGQDFNGSMDSLGGFGSPRVGVQRLEGVESNGANQASMPKRVNIGEDLDPLLLSVAHPLAVLKEISGTALEVIPDFASQPIAPAADKEAEATANDTKKETDEEENVSSSNSNAGGGIILDRKMVELQNRRLALVESLDLLAVVDFIREFGEEFLELQDVKDLSLGTLENMFYDCSTHYTRLLSIYLGFLLYIYPRARFRGNCETIDIPSHLSHHFACSITASTTIGSFIIDARYLCKIFSQVDFLDIPAPFHAAALTSLIASCQAQKRFHDMQNVCQDEVEVVKKERYAASHRGRDLRLVAKNLESEIAATESAKKELEVVVNDTQYLLDNGKGRKEPEDAPPRVLTAEEKSRHNQTIRETRNGIQNYDRDLIAKRAQLTRANEDAERAEARAAESVARLAQINMRLRSSSVRLMGHDRFGSLYFWIDLGYSDEQTFPIPNQANNEVLPKQEGSSKDVNMDAKEDKDDDESKSEKAESDEKEVNHVPTDRYRIGGILVDSLYTTYPSEGEPGYVAGQDNANRSRYTFIDSVPLLKTFVHSLNERGNRERELLSAVRTQFLEFGVEFPSSTVKRAWDTYLTAPLTENEEKLNSGFKALAHWIQALGRPLVVSPESPGLPDKDMNASSDSLVSASSASALRKGRGRTKTATDPKKVFEKMGYKTVGARLKELMPLMGTKPDSNATNKREKDKADSLHRFEDAITLAKDVISRKYGMGTVAELKDRLDKCESIPMLCVLLSDVIRETKTKKLNDWVEETRDGGWVEEEEDTTEADEISKGKAANKEKPKLTRRPRKVKNAAASD